MRRNHTNKGCCFAAFGAGVLLAMVCPVKLILVLATAALILTGIALIRCG